MSLRMLVLAAAAAGALGVTGVAAQYPQPGGAVTAAPDDPNPPPNGQSGITVRLVDGHGQVIANGPCVASIASQPGRGASVVPTVFVTGVDGTARLSVHMSDAPGPVQVVIDCGGKATLVTLGTAHNLLPPTGGAGSGGGGARPRASGDVPKPPDTGQGADAKGGGGGTLAALAGTAAAALAAGGILAARRRRR